MKVVEIKQKYCAEGSYADAAGNPHDIKNALKEYAFWKGQVEDAEKEFKRMKAEYENAKKNMTYFAAQLKKMGVDPKKVNYATGW